MKAIENLEISIKSLSVYPIEENIIKDMLAKLSEIRTELASQLEPLVSPHTEHFEQWLNKYFVSDGTHYCYKTRSGHKLFTLKELYKKFERAMKESPIVAG